MSTLSRRIDKLETHLEPAAAYVVDSWDDYWRLHRAFLGAGVACWQGVRLRMQPNGDMTSEARARLEEERDRLEAAIRARHADTTKPVEERYTYHEALAAGVIKESSAFQAEYAAEVARWEAGEYSQHFPPRSFEAIKKQFPQLQREPGRRG